MKCEGGRLEGEEGEIGRLEVEIGARAREEEEMCEGRGREMWS
jgi:hypothetical protein